MKMTVSSKINKDKAVKYADFEKAVTETLHTDENGFDMAQYAKSVRSLVFAQELAHRLFGKEQTE